MKISKNKKRMIIEHYLHLQGAKLLDFEYYTKVFGNLFVLFEFEGEQYTVESDRGEISINGKYVMSSKYHLSRCDDVMIYLLLMMERYIFCHPQNK